MKAFLKALIQKKMMMRNFIPKKRGRGSQKQTTVMVMASTVHDFKTIKKYNKANKIQVC